MQKKGSRQIRRNIDALYTAPKESRSLGKRADQNAMNKPQLNETGYQLKDSSKMNIYNPQKPLQVLKAEPTKKGTQHSQSQQLIENSLSIQQKIFTQQQKLQKQTGNSPATQFIKNAKHGTEYPTQSSYQTIGVSGGPSTDSYLEKMNTQQQFLLDQRSGSKPDQFHAQTRNMANVTNSRSGLVLKNQQTLGALLNNSVYNQIQVKEQSPLKINAKKKHGKQGNQVMSFHQLQQYGQPMARQYTSKQMANTHHHHSAHAQHQQTFQSTKESHNSSHLSTQPLQPLQETTVLAQNHPADNNIAIQQFQHNSKLIRKDEIRNYKGMNQFQRSGSVDDQVIKSRNSGSANHTTNGVASQNNNSNAAILNINTASDINIYNNSFIVKTSQNKAEKGKLSSRSQSKRNQKQTATSKNSQKAQANDRQLNNNSALSNFAMNFQNQSDQNYPRSLSQGRGQKPSVTQNTTYPISSNSSLKAAELPKVHAVAEAYSQQQTPMVVANNSQPLQSWRSNQMANSKGFGKTTQNEKTKLRADSSDATETKPIKKTMLQYNNLFDVNIDQQAALQQLRRSSMRPKHFTNAKESLGSSLAISRATLIKDTNNTVSQNMSQANLDIEGMARRQKEDKVRDLIIQGRKKIQTKEYSEAIKFFTQVLDSHDSKNQKAIFYRALSYLDQGNLQQAINEFWQVVSLFKDGKLSAPGSAAQRKPAANQIDSREQEVQFCMQAYILLSIAHKRLGEGQNAIEDLDKCLALFPNYPDALLARGQALLHNEKFEKAFEDLKKFNRLQRDSFVGQLGLGNCLVKMSNHSDAVEAFTAAILLIDSQKTKPNFNKLKVQCYMKRAMASFNGKQLLQALSDFQTVIKVDPSEVKAHFYIGKLLAKGIENQVSKKEEAILHFEQCAKFPEKDFYAGNALFQIAKLRLRNKDYYEAFFSLKRATDSNFASKRMQYYKEFTEAVLYLIKRKIKKGVQMLTDLLDVLLNKEKELAKQQKNEQLNKKLTDPKGENEDPKAKAARLKQAASDKQHRDYLIQQIYIFREYGYVAIEKYELAQEDIKKLKRYGKLDFATVYNKYLGKGILRMDHEDYLMASKYFTKAWKKFPQNKDPYCLQVISIVKSYTFSLAGYSIDQQIKFDKVLQTKRFMDKAIRNCNVKQKEPSLYFFRGLLNFHMHRFYDALQDFNVAIEEEEESTAYFFLARGRTYACLSVLNEAMKDLSVALNLDETLQQGYIYRGKCAYLIGDNNLAFLDFQRLILTDPKNPMVHIYAGNLLMTTGAYQDAIKAFENADTVEPTAISAFQRVRCYCAMSDLDKARSMMAVARQAQPDDVILQFDNMCLDQLYMVTQVTRQLNSSARTAADIKHADKVLNNSMEILNRLIKTYESDKLTRLKRKDSALNIQLIPNIERVKIEKNAVARDFYELRRTNPTNTDIPDLDYNPAQKVDFAALKSMTSVSYYYENIFGLEDFYLYRGLINFYQGGYKEALQDFREAQRAHNEQSAADKPNQRLTTESRESWFNTQNHSLRLYTDKSVSVKSEKTDLSDVGLCALSANETAFNILLCQIFLDDSKGALQTLADLFKTLPRRYSAQMPLLRALILDHFGAPDKAQIELQRFKKAEPKLHDQVFTQGKKEPFTIELFPSTDRLCAQFEPVALPLAPKGLGANLNLNTRLSFSIPFIKPPNMIPNVDEDAVHGEFNLKQIDAPMPEAPWIKRCQHGINFTSKVQLDSITDITQQQKYKQFFEAKKEEKKSSRSKESSNKMVLSGNAAGARLLDQIQEDAVSDKRSLMDDSRIGDEECAEKNCEANQYGAEASKSVPVRSGLRSQASNQLISAQQSNLSDENEYESDDDEEDSDDDYRKIISAHDELLLLDRDSVVNFGTNMVHELKKQKKIKQHIQNMIATGNNPAQILPNAEAAKAIQEKSKRDRYDQDEQKLIEDEKMESIEFQSTGLFRSRVVMPKKDPVGLDHNMLIGQQAKKKKRERHISNLSISECDNNEAESGNTGRASLFKQKVTD